MVPELLLLDEPLASVDSKLMHRVLAYLESVICEWHIPTICVTHDPREVQRLAQWVVVAATAIWPGKEFSQTFCNPANIDSH